MIGESEALAAVLRSVDSLSAREVALDDALNCFAADDIFARIALPGFDNSAMDGYAVSAPGLRFRVVGEQPAGPDRKLRVSGGEAVRIFTGAPIPDGADAVVMQEDVVRDGDDIVLKEEAIPGEFIRRKGCDLAPGQKLVFAGQRLPATLLALLASQGLEKVRVGGAVKVAIISTGDELAAPGSVLGPGQIYDSNSLLLSSLVRQIGAQIGFVKHAADRAEEVDEAIAAGMKFPVLMVSGGVSVGAHDLVQDRLRKAGGKIDIWRVAVKPGKPFLFGKIGGCAFFGLPGNPVSAFVTFLQFVRPAILKMMGANDKELALRQVPAHLSAGVSNDGERAHYYRGRLEAGRFMPVGRQESHALFGLSQANALLRVKPGEELTAGTAVTVQIWE